MKWPALGLVCLLAGCSNQSQSLDISKPYVLVPIDLQAAVNRGLIEKWPGGEASGDTGDCILNVIIDEFPDFQLKYGFDTGAAGPVKVRIKTYTGSVDVVTTSGTETIAASTANAYITAENLEASMTPTVLLHVPGMAGSPFTLPNTTHPAPLKDSVDGFLRRNSAANTVTFHLHRKGAGVAVTFEEP